MKIITIDREFGSGGRELGKRLADALNIPCYDQKIIDEVAKLHGLSSEHIDRISEADIRAVYPHTIGCRFAAIRPVSDDSIKVAVTQKSVIQRLAKQGDCVVVGRGADVILKEEKPLNIFVYADQTSKLARCLKRSKEKESWNEILRKMKNIDKNRAMYRELFADTRWGCKENYHLCVNTSGKEIKALIPALADYVGCWFENQSTEFGG